MTIPTPTDSDHPGADVYSDEGYYAVVPEWVLDADISALAVRLYAVLRRYADQRTMHAHPSRKTLADRLRVKSIRTVDAAIAELKELGALSTFARFTAAGDPDSNGYRLHRVPRAAVAGGSAADCTTPPRAVDCMTPRAADRTRVVQPAAPEPQPSNHSQENHSQTPTPTELVRAPEREREDVDQEPTHLPLVDAPAKPAKGKRKGSGIPADWTLSPELRDKTLAKFPWMSDAQLDDEASAFVNWHEGQKSTWTDYDRAWWHWTRRFRPPITARPGRPAPYRNGNQSAETIQAKWSGYTGRNNP